MEFDSDEQIFFEIDRSSLPFWNVRKKGKEEEKNKKREKNKRNANIHHKADL